MHWSGAPVYGVSDCDFDFDSQEWSGSEAGKGLLNSKSTIPESTKSNAADF